MLETMHFQFATMDGKLSHQHVVFYPVDIFNYIQLVINFVLVPLLFASFNSILMLICC